MSTLATGAALTPETFADFVERLRFHCKGEGVSDHCTADAIFNVERRVLIYGISEEYTDKLAIICDESVWHSIGEFLEDCDKDAIAELDRLANSGYETSFVDISELDQYDLIERLPDHNVTGWDERWETLNSHFTKEAADAFIKRKAHDYPDGLRVYVDAQSYCWEWNAIKEALMSGRLTLAEPEHDTKGGAA